MLSGTPPKVVNVEVSSTAWTPAFASYLQTAGLGTHGYAIPKGSSAQSATLTWTNLDQILITFSEDVVIQEADLSLSGINTTAYTFSDFHYDPQTYVARWTLNAPLGKDRLRLDLDADGIDPVTDLDGNVLDGEWTNNVSTMSGNGVAGGDFQFNLNVLLTDVNNSANVTNYDYLLIRQLDGKTTTSSGYIAKRDVNGDGTINSADWQEAIDRAFETLPSGSPAGTSSDAPTTSGIGLINLSDEVTSAAISLLSNFGDLESGASGLSYSVIANSDDTLVTAWIDGTTQELRVAIASGVGGGSGTPTGRATVTVRATDSNGLLVDTEVTIDVNRENLPPVISDFLVLNVGPSTYLVTGFVHDPDDHLEDFIVRFSGVFATRAAVDENGYFEFAIILEPGQLGLEYAVTTDPHGLESNTAFCEIALT